MAEYSFLYLPVKEGYRHARLYVDDADEILKQLLSDEYKSKLSRLFLKEDGAKSVSMYDGVVNVTEISLFSKTKYDPTMDEHELSPVGLYIRIEQNKPDRRSIYDNALAEIFIMDGKMLYCVTSADDNRYNLSYLDPDDVYLRVYNRFNEEMGLKLRNGERIPDAYKLELKPFEVEEKAQIEKQNIGGIFQKKKRDALNGALTVKYSAYKKEYEKYMGKISKVIKEARGPVKLMTL